jgi:DNA-binding beta-propeller fold protein YncE
MKNWGGDPVRKGFLSVILAGVLTMAVNAFAAEITRFTPVLSVYMDVKGVGINQPEGVACDDKSLLVVADTGNGRLLRFQYAEGNLSPREVIAVPQLPYPIKVQITSKGEILALDGKLRRIARLTPAGEFQGYVEPTGVTSPGAIVPRSFKVDNSDNLYILDVFSDRILVTDPAGKVQREIPLSKKSGFFSDLAIGPSGNVFLLDSVGKKVFQIAKGSQAVTLFGEILKENANFPTGITVDQKGIVYVVDENGSGIVILGRDGSFLGRRLNMGWKEGLLRYPSDICMNNSGVAFIADRGNNRVQIFSISQ